MTTNAKLIEAGKVLKDAMEGDHVARGIVRARAMGQPTSYSESFSTSDLVDVFTVGLNQKTEQQYAEEPRVWTEIAKTNKFSDFREQEVLEFDWNKPLDVVEQAGRDIVPGGLAVVPEGTEYPTFGYKTGSRRVKLHKHGARMPFFFEYVINDQWNLLNSLPAEMLKKARTTEEIEIMRQLVTKEGINTDTFSGAASPSDAALTIDNLREAMESVENRKVDGRYVTVNSWVLLVPTTLRIRAQQILDTTEWEETDADGKTFKRRANYGNVKLVSSEVLLDINQSADAASTWFLLPAGGSDGTRDSLVNNFLEGHESPEIRVHGDTGSLLGGGSVDFKQGSFLNDSLQYRVRHIVTGSVSHNSALYASTGTV